MKWLAGMLWKWTALNLCLYYLNRRLRGSGMIKIGYFIVECGIAMVSQSSILKVARNEFESCTPHLAACF